MEYVAVIFTPYSVQAGLADVILSEIGEKISFAIALRRRVCLSEQDVEILYPKLIDKSYFQDIVTCLIDGEAEFVLIVADSIQQKVGQLKGKFIYRDGSAVASGLRDKYKKDNNSFEFVFHTTDSNTESDEIGLRLFGLDYQCSL